MTTNHFPSEEPHTRSWAFGSHTVNTHLLPAPVTPPAVLAVVQVALVIAGAQLALVPAALTAQVPTLLGEYLYVCLESEDGWVERSRGKGGDGRGRKQGKKRVR